MKIGDKVRFLSAVGGGTVKSFRGKDLVLVEEDDGFEIPVLIKDCIVIDDAPPVSQPFSARQPQPAPAPAPATVYQPEQLPGKDKINACIAFLPDDIKKIGRGTYEAYFVNDSNYSLYINCMQRENNACKSIYTGLIEPNTKCFLNEFTAGEINSMERICVQFIAFKTNKPFALKDAFSIDLRIDTSKFYKLHCFRENDYFEDDAILYALVSDDVAKREIPIDAAALQQAIMQKTTAGSPPKRPVDKLLPDNPVTEVDLHINQLLDTTAGMSNADMLAHQLSVFHQTLAEFKNRKGQKIVFIHGKGEGVLRNAILTALKTTYKNYPSQDASFSKYGFGATMVTIK
jgi:hypothetical protein